MDCQIFISYRRKDSEGMVNWIYKELSDEFGDNALFMDTGSVKPGDNWEDKIYHNLRKAKIVLVVIGEKWLNDMDKESDDVRKELETALDEKKIIFPILINNVEFPLNTGALPDTVKKLIKKIEAKQPYPIKVGSGHDSGIEGLVTIINEAGEDELTKRLKKVIANEYEIDRVIAEGARHKVYLGRDMVLERIVTIRVAKEGTDEQEFINTLKDAAMFTACIPNCIQIYGAWDIKPAHVAMSYVEGNTLRQEIDDSEGEGIPSLSLVHRWLQELCNAIKVAHDSEVTHCNIKPSNIYLGKNSVPYLSPLRRFKNTNKKYYLEKFSRRLTDPNTPFSTEDLYYLPPEIITNFPFKTPLEKNKKIDQYMLGLIGYDMLTGKIPPTITTFDDLKTQGFSAFKPLARITTIRTDCPGKLSDIIHRMISYNPSDRYESLEEVVDDLEKFSPDDVEVAWDSFTRCLKNDLGMEFFKAFYQEFLRISPEAENKFKEAADKHKGNKRKKNKKEKIGKSSNHRQYSKLRDAIYILFMFAKDNKLGTKEPNILSRIAEMHSREHYDIPHDLYEGFVTALMNTVCGAPPGDHSGTMAFDELCKDDEQEKIKIQKAWRNALKPGIEYMIKHY